MGGYSVGKDMSVKAISERLPDNISISFHEEPGHLNLLIVISVYGGLVYLFLVAEWFVNNYQTGKQVNGSSLISVHTTLFLTHCSLVDCSTLIYWKSPFAT